ncbi:MAG: GH3 auxin-responsive promoter family protein [Acidobacteriota bacterium]
MNKVIGKACIILANLCWLISSIPGWFAFRLASRRVKRTQLAILRRIIRTNEGTKFGWAHHFETLSGLEDFRGLPLSEYEDYEDFLEAIKAGYSNILTGDSVKVLQPTSGSTAATKLIPYTGSLKTEFKAAVDPWIASMYMAYPSLLRGRHYWSISPTTPCPTNASSKVRIGFADDSEYLGAIQRFLVRTLFAVPLRPDAARAQELRNLDVSNYKGFDTIWPHLKIISCWTDGVSEPWLTELIHCFPQAIIQGKGLTATEGIISFPSGDSGRPVCAVRSHFLEFIHAENGKAYCAWELEEGQEYSVVLTSSGGLYRYRLHDRVQVTGYDHQAPRLKFIERENLVSDMVGEKLNGKHVELSIGNVEKALDLRFRFAMLAPLEEHGDARYVFYMQLTEGSDPNFQSISKAMETELARNYYYQNARELSQLQHLKVFNIDNKQDAHIVYRQHYLGRGAKSGEIKFSALSVDRTWTGEFPGEYIL